MARSNVTMMILMGVTAALMLGSCGLFVYRLRWLCMEGRRRAMCAKLRELLRACLDVALPWLSPDPARARINKLQAADMLKRTRASYRLVHPVFCVLAASMWWEHLRAAPAQPLPALDYVYAIYTLLAYCVILLFDTCPRAVTLWSSRAVQASVYAGGVGALAVQDAGEVPYIRFVALFALLRLGLVIAHDGDVAITLGLNLVYFAISSILCPYKGVQALEFLAAVLIVAVTSMYGHSRRSTLEGRSSQKMAVLMADIVSTISDAIVHLSSDLDITLPTPQLQVMLLRSSKDALMGTNFMDLVGDGDMEAEHLEQFLRREDGAASLLHTNLKDSYNTTVRVQLFHAHGPDADGKTMHVMAILENAEMGRTPPPANMRVSDRAASARVATIVEGKKSSASTSANAVQLEGNDSTVVWIDHISDGFPIIKCSPGFTALSGPSLAGTNFLEWVQNEKDLLDHLPLLGSDTPSGEPPGPVKLELKMPQMPPGVKKVRVDVQIRLVRECGKDMAMLTFGEIKPKRSSSSSKQVAFNGDDDRFSTVTFTMYADNNWEISALRQEGQFTDIGLEVGRNFLDYMKDRKALTHQISGKLLFPAEANISKFIKSFKPKWIGSYAMRQPDDPTGAWHDISIEVTDFAMSNAGPYLCCTTVLHSQELAV